MKILHAMITKWACLPFHSFPDLEPVHCSMSSSNHCFLSCIQISQEACKVVWYSYLFKNFPQFSVIHTVKGFGVVNKADVFPELSWFFYDSMDIGNFIFGSSAFSKCLFWCWNWFQIGKGARQGCILSPCLFNLYAEYIMQNAGLDEAQAGIKTARRNVNNLRYADDTILMVESEE